MPTKNREPDVPRLCQAITRARLMLRLPREAVKEATRQYVGIYWSEEGARTPVPVNLLSMYVQIMTRALVSKNPRVLLSTHVKESRPAVETMQAWVNEEMERMQIGSIFQRIVVDALFSIGICKVALATPSDAATRSWSLQAGKPFVAPILLDDFVYDPNARAFEEVGFIGHRYRVPIDTVKDSKLYTKQRKELEPTHVKPYNMQGDERVHMLGRTYVAGTGDEYEDMVDLWEIYLPRDRLVLTIADDEIAGPSSTAEPLRTQRWIGPDLGPYHILGFGTVPGNPMPKAPIQDLVDLHESANHTMRKIMRTMERIKELTICGGGNTEDLERIMSASDGEGVSLRQPEMVRQLVINGESLQRLIATFTTINDLFSRQAGNLDILGGLAPQAKTATQDSMLNQNSSRMVSSMQEEVVSFVSRVIKSLCWYYKHDPITVQEAPYSPAGMPNLTTMRKVTPEQRQTIPFEQMKIRVDPYSLRHKSPEEKLAGINQVVQQVIMPMMPIMQQAGIAFDVNAYLEIIKKYQDQPELSDLTTIREPPEAPVPSEGGGGEMRTMPQSTSREYTRNNVSSQTRDSANRNLVASMLGNDLGGSSQGNSNGEMR